MPLGIAAVLTLALGVLPWLRTNRGNRCVIIGGAATDPSSNNQKATDAMRPPLFDCECSSQPSRQINAFARTPTTLTPPPTSAPATPGKAYASLTTHGETHVARLRVAARQRDQVGVRSDSVSRNFRAIFSLMVSCFERASHRLPIPTLHSITNIDHPLNVRTHGANSWRIYLLASRTRFSHSAKSCKRCAQYKVNPRCWASSRLLSL